MKSSELEIDTEYEVKADGKGQTYGKMTGNKFKAKVLRIGVQSEVTTMHGDRTPKTVEIEWTDERLYTREYHIKQIAEQNLRYHNALGRTTLTKNNARKDAEKVVDRRSKYRGRVELIYSGAILRTWAEREQAEADANQRRKEAERQREQKHEAMMFDIESQVPAGPARERLMEAIERGTYGRVTADLESPVRFTVGELLAFLREIESGVKAEV